MKVILAGYSKTGTKTLNAALTTLGYQVYDYAEHYWYHGDNWKRIFDGEGSLEDFKRMYKDVDVVVDAPAYLFWEEIHWAFPDAKIILTVREEDSWYKSLCNQLNPKESSVLIPAMVSHTPTGKKFMRHVQRMIPHLFGMELISAWNRRDPSELIAKQKYRHHNAYVLEKAPKDKLLVFNVKEGWGPLCTFLGKDIPDTAFPHKNKDGKDVRFEFMDHPMARRVKKEFIVMVCLVPLVILLLCASLKYFPWDRFFTLVSIFFSALF